MDVRPLSHVGIAGAHGRVDFRLARRRVVRGVKSGRLSRSEVCDAHPELLRAARNLGTPTTTPCPLCEDAEVVHVQYVFGPRLPPNGKLVETPAELARLDRRPIESSCYTVEVCAACGWNHLVTLEPIGQPPIDETAAARTPARTTARATPARAASKARR